jgi:hypothetical protein
MTEPPAPEPDNVDLEDIGFNENEEQRAYERAETEGLPAKPDQVEDEPGQSTDDA